MNNPFQATTFYERLHQWRDIRRSVADLTPEQQLAAIHHWWMQAPLVKQTMHWDDLRDLPNVPNPWELLDQNLYCPLTRALGICYTMQMLELEPVLHWATDEYGDDCYLVTIADAKYAANYHSLVTLNNSFQIKRTTETTQFRAKY